MPRNLRWASFALVLAVTATATPAVALEHGVVTRGYFTAHGRFGNFYGAEARLLRNGPAFLGVSGFGGPVLNAPRSALGYGGVVAGVGSPVLGGMHVASRLWVGGGGGLLEGQRLIALSFEPSVSLGFPVSEQVTGSVTVGYLQMLGIENLHGLVIGFRADM